MTNPATSTPDHPEELSPLGSASEHPIDPLPGVSPHDTAPTQHADTVAAEPEKTPTDDETPPLLTEAQVEALKDSPEKLRKELQKAFTQKTQQLATERKELASYKDLIDAFRDDPKATLTALAQQAGLELHDPKAPTSPAVDPSDTIKTALREALGPEYEDLADRLAPALQKAVEVEATRLTTPLRQHQDEMIRDTAIREAQTQIDAFGKTHPDWKEFEPAMTDLAKKLPPGTGMTETEYLEVLYTVASKDRAVGEEAKKVITRMTKSAETASRDTRAVAPDKVALSPVGPPTWEQAKAAALRGQRLE